MLLAMHNAMIDVLKAQAANDEIVDAYRKRWSETLEGRSRSFPCPACFMAGVQNSELKALPAKANTPHYVQCKLCNRSYSYIEEEC